ncbi:MAG TPA: CHAT domain-containing protein, partial [Thermoanaerobaculia bacterium]|nr:CHAT domain-containing protein [Thermoanaerobaculia bacterium]
LRLAVLSACRTAVGYYPESEEISHLAGAFLAAGVPAVVASLWEVEDSAAATLMTAFHRRLAAGIQPAEALRQTQMELAGSPDPRLASPATWAAFRLLGAD